MTDPSAADNPANGADNDVPIVVGVGASAGGLDALERFFDHMPADSGMAFVVIQHLSPDYKSLMEELLSKRTRMPIHRVQNGIRVEADNVYLIPPKNNMIIFEGKLLLTEHEATHGVNLPIDIFLRSLAEDRGEQAVGIILSGTGSDGMRGVRAIKEAGGLVLVQDTESAQFDGMPRSAISTGLVDYVGRPEDMPAQLLNYREQPTAPHEVGEVVISEDVMGRISGLLRKQTGLDLMLYKPSTVSRRIQRRLHVTQIETLPEYLEYMRDNPREVSTLYKEILIGVTSFFRDHDAFEVLREKVIPELFEEAQKRRRIRAWVAGCSTGEEAYSIAILLREHARVQGLSYDIKVFATDIDRDAVEFASAGIYPENIAPDIPPDLLDRYFLRQEGRGSYQVKRHIREMVIFAPQNLMRDPPFTKIDLLTCRNLLIYLRAAAQKKLLSLFNFSLRLGGILFLGASETVGDMTEQFRPLDSKWKIWRNRSDTRPALVDTLHLSNLHDRLRGPAAMRLGGGGERSHTLEPILQSIFADQLLPPAVVVNDAGDILHVLGDVRRYLWFQPGAPSTNITRSIRGDLTMAVQTALHRADKDRREVVYRDVPVGEAEDDQQRRALTIRVRPVPIHNAREYLYIVFFETRSRTVDEAGEAIPLGRDPDMPDRVADLEQELRYTKENLQATIEELETSNEELQATNEELVASNEELQSTNEELQSVNEELYTVNAEYQSKIQELTDLNSDMDNLLLSTRIGTLFLDENLCIRRFTPAVAELIHLMEHDIDRPLAHLGHSLVHDRLVQDASDVLQQGTPIIREIATREGDWVLMRITPYEPAEGGTHGGVVITFVDITRLKAVEADLRHERDLLGRIMDTTPTAVMKMDSDGRITYANRRAEQLFGLDQGAITNRRYNAGNWEVQSINGRPMPDERLPFRRVMDSGEPQEEMLLSAVDAQGNRLYLSVNGTPLRYENGEIEGVLAVFYDITEQLEAESLRRLREAALEEIPSPVWTTAPDGTIRYRNAAAARLDREGTGEIGNRLAALVAPEEGTADEILERARRGDDWHGYAALKVGDGQRRAYLHMTPHRNGSDSDVLGIICCAWGSPRCDGLLACQEENEDGEAQQR